VGRPVIVVGECLVDAVIEVLVVRENDMATDVVELAALLGQVRSSLVRTGATHKAFRGDVCRGQTTGDLVRVHDQPRGPILLSV
jgi:hypothetical protein